VGDNVSYIFKPSFSFNISERVASGIREKTAERILFIGRAFISFKNQESDAIATVFSFSAVMRR
jgi:hypothetical protein